MDGTSQERKHTRFKPSPLAHAQIDTSLGEEFNPNIVGLIMNESARGCAVVTLAHQDLRTDAKVKIKLGDSNPVRALIRWREQPELDLLKLGFEFMD